MIENFNKLPAPQAVIFDMDGVLVDESASYRAVIARACEIYLTQILNLRPFVSSKSALIAPADITALKLVGGFNNDWDATAGLLTCLLAMLPTNIHLNPFEISGGAKIREVCQLLHTQATEILKPLPLEELQIQKEQKLGPLLAAAQKNAQQNKQSGLAALKDVLDISVWDNIQLCLWNKGDLHHTNVVERIFQELYLGPDRFQESYGDAPIFYYADGYIEREKLIISVATLETLQQRGIKLGVATGRPGGEARYALDFFELNRFFKVVVTDDERSAAEAIAKHKMGKPHPFVLLEAARRLDLNPNGLPIYYLGDVPDDVLAANRAKAEMPAFRSVGLQSGLPSEPHERAEAAQTLLAAFRYNAADYILEHPDQIIL